MKTRVNLVAALAATVTAALTTTLLLPVAGAHAEHVVIGSEGTTTFHDKDMPATGEPWRTLVAGSLTTDTTSHMWKASATLAGAVPAGQSLTISWVPGRQHPTGCEPFIQLTESVTVTPADNTVSIDRYVAPGYFPETPMPEPSCLEVFVSNDGIITDKLIGPMFARTTLAGAQARPASPLRVAVGRTTPVLMLVSSHARDAAGVTINGSGPGVAMEEVKVGPLVAEQVRPVVARISAPGVADSELAVTARDPMGSDSFDQAWRIRARDIAAQRPLPGRYKSTDGSVRFTLSEDHKVVRLRTTALQCDGYGSTRAVYPTEFKLPRHGATAQVTQLGSRWFGAQLQTRKPRRIAGTFVFTTQTCWASQVFVAVRQR